MNELIEDIELSFRLFEFSVRTMCYAEPNKFDINLFGKDLQLNLENENVSYPSGGFVSEKDIVMASQMAVGAAFGSTAICLDRALENYSSNEPDIKTLMSLIAAVRNAFSHGIAAPAWYVKEHKREELNLNFVQGPIVNLDALNGQLIEYEQKGGLAVWYRIKNYVISEISST